MHELAERIFLLKNSTLTGTLSLITSQQKNSTLGGASPHQIAFQTLGCGGEERKDLQKELAEYKPLEEPFQIILSESVGLRVNELSKTQKLSH